ncbi:MAG: thermonuclease family protein [Alphaproteobacteria bacterium]
MSAAAVFAAGLGSAAALAAAAAPAAAADETGSVKSVIDGDTLELADGRTVRLVGITAPKPPLDAEPGRRWPLAERATATLKELALGRALRLVYGGRKSDRYGRLLAQLYRDDGLWLQGELLARGVARVFSHKDNRALVADMLAREREAREARRGLWAVRGFTVLEPQEARRHLESFELVEGSVERVARAGSRDYLRMGADPKSGFTAVLLPESRRLFAAAGLSADGYAGRRVRVRGVLRWWDGAIIEVTHPEQIELVTP